MKSESHSVMPDSLQPNGLYSPWNSPGQNTGVGSLSLLQVIFPTQGLNPGLPRSRQILYQLSYQGSPRTVEWVAYPFSRSSLPRNWTRVSCIEGGFFTSWQALILNLHSSHSSVHRDFTGKNGGMGCHFLLQGIYLTQGLNPRLLLGRQILYLWAMEPGN